MENVFVSPCGTLRFVRRKGIKETYKKKLGSLAKVPLHNMYFKYVVFNLEVL